MAIKGGQILHVSGGFIIDRIQTGGLTGINVNETRLEELGNYQAIGTIRDIPDLTFELESYDVTTELESILTGGDNTEIAGTNFDLATNVPINILSPFKSAGVFTVDDGGVIIPQLSLESMSYSFSLTDPATMSATLRGDSVFYAPGVPYEETFSGDNVTTTFNFTNGPAFKSAIGGDDYYALSVTVDGVKQRLTTDYTNTATGVTFTTAPPTGTDNIVICYASAVQATYNQGVHIGTGSPAGVRGRDIQIQLAGSDWLGVQSANIDWSVSLERDEEFDNPFIVGQDFDTPEVSGSITMKPADVAALYAQIQAAAGLTSTDIANATAEPPSLNLEIIVKDPADGTTEKTFIVTDAKFNMPSLQGSVGSKLETDFTWVSDSGVLNVYKGDN
jgi:hypothetical protein